jgi:hypothetical protein
VFEDPGGAEEYEHGGWTFEYDRGSDGDRFKLDEVMEAEVQLLGRVTYEGFAARIALARGRVRREAQRGPEVRGLENAEGSRVAEHDRDLR